MTDQPALLEQLIIAGEMALQMRSTRPPETLTALLEAVETEYNRPADGQRVIDMDTIIFGASLIAAGAAMAGHNRSEAAKYLRVIGVLMPDIRAALGVAIEIRKRPTP